MQTIVREWSVESRTAMLAVLTLPLQDRGAAIESVRGTPEGDVAAERLTRLEGNPLFASVVTEAIRSALETSS
jgi:hypothetical protein